MKKSSLFLVLIVPLLCLQQMPTLDVSGQDELLPVPREETLFLHFSQDYLIFDNFNYYMVYNYENGIMQVASESLYYYEWTTGEVIKWLSTGWNYSQDYKTLTIYLREGVTWSDGQPFTSADIAFTINMMIQYEGNLSRIGDIDHVESVETPDAYTVVIHLSSADPRFHTQFMCQTVLPYIIIAPKHIWEGEDPTTFTNNPPVTTGPYKFKETIPDLKMFVWERREDYWGKTLGYFPEPKYVVYQTQGDATTEFELLKANKVDFAAIGYDLAKDIRRENPEIVLMEHEMEICPKDIIINCIKYPLTYPEVRWAIAYCINYEKWANLLRPAGFVAGHPITACPQYAFADVLDEYRLEYDIDKAKALLDGLGFTRGTDGIYVTPNGTRLSIEYLSFDAPGGYQYEIGVDLATEALKAGIEINIRRLEFAAAYGMVLSGQHQLAGAWMCGATTEPLPLYKMFMSYTYGPAGLYWWQGDQTFDELVTQIESMTPDDPAIMPLYKQCLEIWMDNLPSIPTIGGGAGTFAGVASTAYWEGWPTQDNLYTLPTPHAGQFMFAIFKLTSGKAVLEAHLEDLVNYISELETNLNQAIEELRAANASASTYTNAAIAIAVISLIVSIVAVARSRLRISP